MEYHGIYLILDGLIFSIGFTPVFVLISRLMNRI